MYMNLDLLSMAALSMSALVVVKTMTNLLGSTSWQRIQVGGLLGIWFIGVTVVGATNLIVGGGAVRTAGLGVLVVAPILILSLVTFLSSSLQERIGKFNLLPLISVQALRVLGVIFVLLFATDRLPGPFAPLAGFGDMLVGLLAIPLAWAVASGRNPRLAISLWGFLGIADLVNALTLGVLSAPSPFQVFRNGPSSAIMPMLPWILIPGFLVPCFFFLHFVVIVKLRTMYKHRST